MVARHGPEKIMDEPIVIEAIAQGKKFSAVAQSLIGSVSDKASVSSAIQDMVYSRRVETLRAA